MTTITEPGALIEYAELEQGTEEWLEARRGLVTASVLGQLVTVSQPSPLTVTCPECGAEVDAPCLSRSRKEPAPIKTLHGSRVVPADAPDVVTPADNDTSRALTASLVAERITGWVDPVYVNADMQRGNDIEPIARDLYSEKYAPVDELGFMVRVLPDGHRLGYSPDGLVGDDGLIEVKAPRAKTHLLTILSGQMPKHHMAQVQAGLLVSGRQWCDFVSFYGGMRPFVKRVHPDPRWFEAITATVAKFETTAAEMQAKYEANTAGLPETERYVDLADQMEI